MALDGVNNVSSNDAFQGGGQSAVKKDENLNSIMDKALRQATAKTNFEKKVMMAKDDDGFESKYPELREHKRMAEPAIGEIPKIRNVTIFRNTTYVARDTIFVEQPVDLLLDSGKDVKSEK